MAAIDKAIELLEKVLEENYKLSEGYEIKPETRDEIEGWLKWYNDLQKRADGVSPNENSGLNIPVVSQRSELLKAFIRWNNKHNGIAQPVSEKMADNYLKSL